MDKNTKKFRNFCPLVCKVKCKENVPTSATTVEIFKFCYQDEPEFKYKGNVKNDCAWASESATTRCGKKDQDTKKRVNSFPDESVFVFEPYDDQLSRGIYTKN